MAGISVLWTGGNQLVARLTALAMEAPAGLGAALYIEAQAIMEKSLRITPIDTGALRSSGHVDAPKIEGRTATVEMGFGGAAAPYALYVHEITTSYHKPPTQAKYLEQPFNEAIQGMNERLAHSLAVALKVASI